MVGGLTFGVWLPWILGLFALVFVWYIGIFYWGKILNKDKETKE